MHNRVKAFGMVLAAVCTLPAMGAQWLSDVKYGNGSDGDLTVAVSATFNAPNTGCAGTSGQTSLTLNSAAGFADGDIVLIHQSRGTGAGTWELNRVFSGGGTTTLALASPLSASYLSSSNDRAQILKLYQYASVTLNSGVTWTVPDWNGSQGGILAFLCQGTTHINGTIDGYARGYSGGPGIWMSGRDGDGTAGEPNQDRNANGSGGGGGFTGYGNGGSHPGGGGGGGGHAAGGGNGSNGSYTGDGGGLLGYGGSAAGASNLSLMVFGGGGAGGGYQFTQCSSNEWLPGGTGGGGGAIVALFTRFLTVHHSTGSININGASGTVGTGCGGSGGGGAGGACLVKCESATLNTTRVTATAGSGAGGGSRCSATGGSGGNGSVGRIHVAYANTYTGTTSPALTAAQDGALIGNLPPTAYDLLNPAHQATLTSGSPVFTWQDSVDPEGQAVTYAIKISRDAAFTDPICRLVGELNAPVCVLSPDIPLADGTYYWKVLAQDAETFRESTSTRQFTVSASTPDQPIITTATLNLLSDQIDRLSGQADTTDGLVVQCMHKSPGSASYQNINGSTQWIGEFFTFIPDNPITDGSSVYVTVGDGSSDPASRVQTLTFHAASDLYRDSLVFAGSSPGSAVRLEGDTRTTFKIVVNGTQPVTVTAQLRKNASYTGTAPSITLTGLGIAGTGGATASLSAAADTWQQVTVTGTPNADGVLTLTFETYSTAAGSAAWIDDITVSQ